MAASATIRAAYDDPAVRTALLTELADAIRQQLPDAPSGRLSDLALRALDARLVARDPESEIVADLRQQYSTDWTVRALLAVAQERLGPAKAPTTGGVSLPYPWCRHPEQCRGRGTCPRDPTCGD